MPKKLCGGDAAGAEPENKAHPVDRHRASSDAEPFGALGLRVHGEADAETEPQGIWVEDAFTLGFILYS
ncbi:hypothetical protein [Glaciimonas immobilis]|uniref:Uncharacterized protein n=1 Tax=Glaciimonas immobilis TaxID=728004 RepID=A0A840RU54_9BURK|nr:hypothetical protein [Glaciimonas immobilis]MBB5201163.1 hypothetical protein [Glaciimonas immobilis]